MRSIVLDADRSGSCDGLAQPRDRALAVKRSPSVPFGAPVTCRCDPFAFVCLP